MDLERAFSLAGSVTLLGWLLLVAAVLFRLRRLRRLGPGLAIPLALSAVYAGLIAAFFGGGEGGFGSLADVAKLFERREVLLAGWIHYLAFDLLIGVRLAEEAEASGYPRLLLLPILVATFLFGPIGFLAFHLTRPLFAARA